MTDVLICSSKDEDDGDILIFEWKVDLCTSGIEFTRYSDGLKFNNILILIFVIEN